MHDIFLPHDYPPEWNDRFYSEQYLLAAYLLAEGTKIEVLLANAFISVDPELSRIVGPLLDRLRLSGGSRHGASFWFAVR